MAAPFALPSMTARNVMGFFSMVTRAFLNVKSE